MTTINEILSFFNTYLPKVITTPLYIIEVTESTQLTNDPGNEQLYFVHIAPDDEDLILGDEDIKAIPLLNNYIGESPLSQGDHHVKVGHPIVLNITILVPLILCS